jgi:hypothetical protein
MVLREKALNGNTRALDRVLELAVRFNDDEVGQAQPLPADDQAILAAYVAETSAARPSPATAESPDDPATKPGARSRNKAPK